MVSVKAGLRSLSYREASPDDMAAFFEQVAHETNDRGACILRATNTEIALTHAIFRILEWDVDTRGRLTSEEGPMSNFAQKIHLGRALRIYGSAMHHNLDYIRAIRNAFAHSHVPITFETAEIARAVGELKVPDILPPRAVRSDGTTEPFPSTPREHFNRVCDIAGHNLMVYAMSALYEKKGPTDQTRSDDHREFLWRKPLP
jgi:hypothetical protein